MIEIKDLYFYYKKKHCIFENLNMEIKKGQIYGILGENGVGKSTLLRIMTGLLFPKEGKCSVFGVDAYKRNPRILEKLFFIPEEFDSPNVQTEKFVWDIGKFYPKFSMEQFHTIINEFEVDTDKKFSQLSYGQKKKVLISLALSTNVELVILDEPTNGLDIPSKAQFKRVIASSANEDNTIIISTHQIYDVENLLDRIIILEKNTVLVNNSIEEIINKLRFSVQTSVPENAIYYEPCLGGYSIIELNTYDEESKLNIESLFNAAIKNKEKFKELFRNCLNL